MQRVDARRACALTPRSTGVMNREAAPRWRSAEPTGCGDELARRLGDADVQPVDAERLGDLRADELGEAAAAGHAAREAGDQPAVGDRVVGRALRRRVDGARREALLHPEVVEQVLGPLGDRAHARQARAVREQVAHRDRLLAARGELRPVRRDRLVVGEQRRGRRAGG